MATILADDPLTQSDAAAPAGQPDPWVIPPSSDADADADEAQASPPTPEPAPASDADEALPPQETSDQGDRAPGEQEQPQAPPLP